MRFPHLSNMSCFPQQLSKDKGRRRIRGCHYENGSVGPQETCVQAEIQCVQRGPGVRWQLTPT